MGVVKHCTNISTIYMIYILKYLNDYINGVKFLHSHQMNTIAEKTFVHISTEIPNPEIQTPS